VHLKRAKKPARSARRLFVSGGLTMDLRSGLRYFGQDRHRGRIRERRCELEGPPRNFCPFGGGGSGGRGFRLGLLLG